MPDHKASIRRRDNLMKEDPFCYYCRKPIFIYKLEEGQSLPDDYATIEHVNSRNQSKPRPAVGKWVMACFRCNQDRGKAESEGRGEEWLKEKEELRKAIANKTLEELLEDLQRKYSA